MSGRLSELRLVSSQPVTPASGDLSPRSPPGESVDTIEKTKMRTPEYFGGVFGTMEEAEAAVGGGKRLYVVRHGETEPNQRRVLQGSGIDEPLNARGRQQAKVLGERMRGCRPVGCVVTSDLKRARETAAIVRSVCQWHDVDVIEEEGLREICWGSWEGQRAPDMEELYAAWNNNDYEAKPPGGESPADCVRRAIPAMERIAALPYDRIFIVAHGRLIRIILSYLLTGSLDNMSRFPHHNTCINILDVYPTNSFSPTTHSSYLTNAMNAPFPRSSFPPAPEPLSTVPRYHSIQSCPALPLPRLNGSLTWVPMVIDDHAHAAATGFVEHGSPPVHLFLPN